MKTSEIRRFTMLLFTIMLFITACSDDNIRPPYLEEEVEPTPETKEFVVYDAMSYKNKPDLTSDMISNIRLIYEAFLLTNEEIDMNKVATQISITKTSNYQAVSTDIEACAPAFVVITRRVGFVTDCAVGCVDSDAGSEREELVAFLSREKICRRRAYRGCRA